MSLNWKEINVILDELPLENSHVQKIQQPDFQSLLFQMYAPGEKFNLFISLSPKQTRIHSAAQRPAVEGKLQRFAQFLRARIGGGRITEAVQIHNDRIIRFVIVKGGEKTLLYIRLWGSAANVIATEPDGTILDAFYRRPKRGEISGGSYKPEGSSRKTEDRFQVRSLPGDGSFNEKIEQYYGELNKRDHVESLRSRVLKLIEGRETKIEGRLHNLQKRKNEYDGFSRYKEFGEIITSNLHSISPGERWLKAEDFYHNNEPIEIELDPKRSGSGNAEHYFELYRKAKSGMIYINQEMDTLGKEESALKEDRETISAAENLQTISEYLRKYSTPEHVQKQHGVKTAPGLEFSSNGFTILVGRTAKENDELLRNWVRGNDYWLHTRDYPGGYVFIKHIQGKSVPLETLLDAGNLALLYSKGRSSGRGDLYYTQVKYLRRAKHGKLGLVIPTQEKNLAVTLDQQRLAKLEEQLDR